MNMISSGQGNHGMHMPDMPQPPPPQVPLVADPALLAQYDEYNDENPLRNWRMTNISPDSETLTGTGFHNGKQEDFMVQACLGGTYRFYVHNRMSKSFETMTQMYHLLCEQYPSPGP
jgi:hypothetical protein